MLNEHYYCTLKYPYNPLSYLRTEDLHAFIVSKLPSLKGKEFTIQFA